MTDIFPSSSITNYELDDINAYPSLDVILPLCSLEHFEGNSNLRKGYMFEYFVQLNLGLLDIEFEGNSISTYESWKQDQHKHRYDIFIPKLGLKIDCKFRSRMNDSDYSFKQNFLNRDASVFVINDINHVSYQNIRKLGENGQRILGYYDFFLEIRELYYGIKSKLKDTLSNLSGILSKFFIKLCSSRVNSRISGLRELGLRVKNTLTMLKSGTKTILPGCFERESSRMRNSDRMGISSRIIERLRCFIHMFVHDTRAVKYLVPVSNKRDKEIHYYSLHRVKNSIPSCSKCTKHKFCKIEYKPKARLDCIRKRAIVFFRDERKRLLEESDPYSMEDTEYILQLDRAQEFKLFRIHIPDLPLLFEVQRRFWDWYRIEKERVAKKYQGNWLGGSIEQWTKTQ